MGTSRRRPPLTGVRFIIPPEQGVSRDGIVLADYGTFVDGHGKLIPVIVDMNDTFRRSVPGLNFSQEDGHRALNGWLGRQLAHAACRRLWWDVRRSGLPRHAKAELRRMRAELGRKNA